MLAFTGVVMLENDDGSPGRVVSGIYSFGAADYEQAKVVARRLAINEKLISETDKVIAAVLQGDVQKTI